MTTYLEELIQSFEQDLTSDKWYDTDPTYLQVLMVYSNLVQARALAQLAQQIHQSRAIIKGLVDMDGRLKVAGYNAGYHDGFELGKDVGHDEGYNLSTQKGLDTNE